MARSIYCSKCKCEKEDGRKAQSYCQKCRTETRLEKLKNAVKKERKPIIKDYKARRPRGSGPNPVCPDCGELKQDIKQTYCNPCRSRRSKDWQLATGRTERINTGRCPCGAERKPTERYLCTICKARSAQRHRERLGNERQAAYQRDYYQRNREKLLEKKKTDPVLKLKRSVRSITNNAIVSGILVRQPCEVCGTIDRIEAHHDDYTKPLEVRWLCKRHHDEHHGNIVM